MRHNDQVLAGGLEEFVVAVLNLSKSQAHYFWSIFTKRCFSFFLEPAAIIT